MARHGGHGRRNRSQNNRLDQYQNSGYQGGEHYNARHLSTKHGDDDCLARRDGNGGRRNSSSAHRPRNQNEVSNDNRNRHQYTSDNKDRDGIKGGRNGRNSNVRVLSHLLELPRVEAFDEILTALVSAAAVSLNLRLVKPQQNGTADWEIAWDPKASTQLRDFDLESVDESLGVDADGDTPMPDADACNFNWQARLTLLYRC